MEIEVNGHSGCSIDIVNDGGQLLICKSTHDPQYVNRLERQAIKQKKASEILHQHIRIPQIFDIEKHENFLNIKMEYVYSKNFVDFFEDAGFEQIDYFIKAIKLFIDDEIRHSDICAISKSVVTEKFDDVCDKIQCNSLINKDKEVATILVKSSQIFSNLPNVLMMPIGCCHGDLTYSNILFNGNNYYLIDFLDSFIESPLLDIVKLRQDSCFSWSELMYTHEFDVIRLQIISNKIDNELSHYYNQYDWFGNYYREFQVMNLLRVLQYAKEERIVTFLKNAVNTLL